jgi:vanillate monooxygenase ferredoxin subunit
MSETLRPVIVAKKIDLAHNMASFELTDPSGAELPAFSAGSHIDVTLPGGLVRQYSLSNSESERNRYVIGVWKDPNSRGGSRTLHTEVSVGDVLQVGPPRNRFRAPASIKRAVLLARGIGVTPMLSLADHFKAKGVPFELHYVFALMSPEAFRDTVEQSPYAENTKFYYEARELNQLLDPAAVLASQPEDAHLFICGVDWWQDPIIKAAGASGWTEERIHVERFTAKVEAAALDKVFDVKIASTGAVFKIPGDKTLSGSLEEQGVKIPTSCEQGMCGTCKVKVLEGEVDHRDKRLSTEEREQGYVLACVSRARSGMLVLDL